MNKVIGVRFKESGKIYYFDPLDIDIARGQNVIVETARGVEFGTCVIDEKRIEDKELVAPLKPVIRVADDVDVKIHEDNKKRAKDAIDICEIKIKEHKLDMKLVDCEYTFDNNKVIFYFTSDGRVDFRELVKDLASIFRTRIELRQIGVRDQAKITGGLSPCGRVACCKQFLGEFTPVSIKMAKEQSLSLNPAKISGLCGRLMCCLKYEQEQYEDSLKKIPPVGTVVITEQGKGTVVDTYTLLELLKVKLKTDDDVEEIKTYLLDEVKITRERDKKYFKANDDDNQYTLDKDY
ncbi:MAG: stage 0 sporulation family protein [Tissierellia bacterium]|nr:stage 0 sporulation family protein [Tissierellia bacterium]